MCGKFPQTKHIIPVRTSVGAHNFRCVAFATSEPGGFRVRDANSLGLEDLHHE